MFRHVAVFRWHEGSSEEAVAEAVRRLKGLPDAIGELRGFSVGQDAGLVEGNFDDVVIADFDDADGYLAYAQHPHHLEMIGQIRPLVAERAATQYSVVHEGFARP